MHVSCITKTPAWKREKDIAQSDPHRCEKKTTTKKQKKVINIFEPPDAKKGNALTKICLAPVVFVRKNIVNNM